MGQRPSGFHSHSRCQVGSEDPRRSHLSVGLEGPARVGVASEGRDCLPCCLSYSVRSSFVVLGVSVWVSRRRPARSGSGGRARP